MSIIEVNFPRSLLSAAAEIELARRIEAGVYAEVLLASPQTRYSAMQLAAVSRRGRSAWQQLWSANLRMVVKLARQAARRHGLPVDDLFQEGCLGLAAALLRFDHTRGLRFSTLAHEHIRRAIGASAASRAGELDGPAHRHRVRQHLRRAAASYEAIHHHSPNLKQLAASIGVGVKTAASAQTQLTPIVLSEPCLAQTDPGFEQVDRFGTDFLDLLAEAGQLLRRRYGLGCPPCTQQELANELGVSATTVARLEQQALAAARDILTADRCRIPP